MQFSARTRTYANIALIWREHLILFVCFGKTKAHCTSIMTCSRQTTNIKSVIADELKLNDISPGRAAPVAACLPDEERSVFDAHEARVRLPLAFSPRLQTRLDLFGIFGKTTRWWTSCPRHLIVAAPFCTQAALCLFKTCLFKSVHMLIVSLFFPSSGPLVFWNCFYILLRYPQRSMNFAW